MLTEREKRARQIAKADKTFGHYQWETLPEPVRETYLQLADDALMAEGIELAEKDRVAAQVWGGDIDLVSFDGE